MQAKKFINSIQGILIIALILRVLAAIFARGYAFHDDHFCVLRVAESWSAGIGHWIEDPTPPKHSMFYAWMSTGIIYLAKLMGISDPIMKATILQLVHGLYSLLTVWLGYRLAYILNGKKNAILVAQILALLWFMPYLGVKFMAELVAVPPLLFAFVVYAGKEKIPSWKWLLIGVMIGLAFSIRIHTLLLAGGIGLVLLYHRQFKPVLLIITGFLVLTTLTIGLPDYLFFNFPFESIVNYFAYNTDAEHHLIKGSPFMYIGTTLGFLVPPVSLMLVWGYFRSFKIEPALFLGILFFFAFHSFFPHKQERFILPMFPFLIILGTIGWKNFVSGSSFWGKHPSLLRGCWNFFWIINVIAGIFIGANYTKKDRVAPLHYLSTQDDVSGVLLDGRQGGTRQTPVYYLGEGALDYNQLDYEGVGYAAYRERPESLPSSVRISYTLDRTKSLDSVYQEFERMQRFPNYVIIYREDSLESRKQDIIQLLQAERLEPVAEFGPSSLDRLLNFLNPRVHKRNDTRIYRVIKQDQ